MRSRAGLFALSTVAVACTEPHVSSRDISPSAQLEARLELSDSLPKSGSDIRVLVRIAGTRAAGADGEGARIASFTTRLVYDTTGMRFVADLPLDDGGTRVSNAQPGVIRSAGVNATGFATGALTGYRFLVLDPAAVRRMRLSVLELHEVGRVNATASVRVPVEPVFVRAP